MSATAERDRIAKVLAREASLMLREESRKHGLPEPDGDYPGLSSSMAEVVDRMDDATIAVLSGASDDVLRGALRGLLGDDIRQMVARPRSARRGS